jgi:hypothetical protein
VNIYTTEDRSKRTCYVQIVEPSKSELTITTKNQQTIVDIPIWYFKDSEAIQKTVLLCENQNDAKFFIHLVKAYLTTKKNLKKAQVKIQATPRGGGGNTIKSELDAQCQSRTFCLCITDNDCGAPDTAFGGTAKRLGLSQTKWQAWQNSSQIDGSITIRKDSALAKAFALTEREVENLMPTALIEKSIPKSTKDDVFEKIDILKEWEKRCPKNWRKFIDLKKGLCGYDVLHWTDDNKAAKKCWLDFSHGVGIDSLKLENKCEYGNDCSHRNKCECILWVGLGDNILSQVIKYMDKETPHKIAEFFNFEDESSLTSLAEALLIWCCALARIHV